MAGLWQRVRRLPRKGGAINDALTAWRNSVTAGVTTFH